MTTREIADRYNVSIPLAARWAKDNGVKRGKPVNGIMPFSWTDEDCMRFEKRRGRGKPRKST